jgi:hypothetical protein
MDHADRKRSYQEAIMRIALAISLLIASLSTASAQFALDHGHAADAVRAANATRDAAAAKAAAIAAGSRLLPSQSTDFSVNGRAVVRAMPVRSTEEQKADKEAQSAWEARCRPTVTVDRDGMRRTQYAERDCDLSRFNTAGMP